MSDFTFGSFRSAAPATSRFSLRSAIADAASVLNEMVRARSTRRMLRDMDDRLLSDIGIGRGDALVEAARPMWDLTQRRR